MTYQVYCNLTLDGEEKTGWTLKTDSGLGGLLQEFINRSKFIPALNFFTTGFISLNGDGFFECVYSLPGLIMTADKKDICIILQHPSNHSDTSLPLLSGKESEDSMSEQKKQWQYYYSTIWFKEFLRLMDNLSIGREDEKVLRETAASNATYFEHSEICYQVGKRWASKTYFQEAFKCYMKAAQQDHKHSIYEIINYYKLGRGTEIDRTLADYWQVRHDQISSPYALSQSILRQLDHELGEVYSHIEDSEPKRKWWQCLCCL